MIFFGNFEKSFLESLEKAVFNFFLAIASEYFCFCFENLKKLKIVKTVKSGRKLCETLRKLKCKFYLRFPENLTENLQVLFKIIKKSCL